MAESCWDARHCARDALSVQAIVRAMPDRLGETPMMDEKLRLDMYRKMILRSRRLEERIAELIKSGQAGGFMHPGLARRHSRWQRLLPYARMTT